MTSLLEQLTSQLSGNTLSQITRQIGGSDDSATGGAIAAALPMILGGLMNNARSSGGAASLGAALDRDHDGSLLDDLGGFLGNSGAQERHGGGILGHVLGSRDRNVTDAVSRSSGLDAGSVKKLMMILAPIVMAQLGKQRRQSRLDDRGLSDLLRGERRQLERQPQLGGLGSLFDRDGDGSAFDDLAKAGAGMLGGLLRNR